MNPPIPIGESISVERDGRWVCIVAAGPTQRNTTHRMDADTAEALARRLLATAAVARRENDH